MFPHEFVCILWYEGKLQKNILLLRCRRAWIKTIGAAFLVAPIAPPYFEKVWLVWCKSDAVPSGSRGHTADA